MHLSPLHILPVIFGGALLTCGLSSAADAPACIPAVEATGEDSSRVEDPQRLALRELAARAAEGDARALRRLAYVHEIGFDSILPDEREATRLYREAAILGDVQAQSMYGYRLLTGQGIAPDTVVGTGWILGAAEQGDPRAANNMGWLLSSGIGVEPDTVRAAEWYLKAAREGLPAGAWNYVSLTDARPDLMPADSVAAPVYLLLGDAFSRGQGLPYSYTESLKYYLRAALYGSERADRILDELLGQMPDALDALPLDSLRSAWHR